MMKLFWKIITLSRHCKSMYDYYSVTAVDACGHVMRRDEEYVGKRVMGIEARGSGRRGRPKKSWADFVKDDLRETRDCQERRRTTEPRGGDYRPISTPCRSGMKKKKKKKKKLRRLVCPMTDVSAWQIA